MAIYESWSGLNPHNDKIWKEFEDQFVPDCGTADTLAGEIVRAMDRLIYRFYNDGDMVGVGYGNETCNSSNRFLKAVIPGWVSLNMFCFDQEKMYEDQLLTNHRIVFAYLMGVGQFTFKQANNFDSREPSKEDRDAAYEYDSLGDDDQ